MLRIALVLPPMCNLNTPYASLPRLAAWLRSLGHSVDQLDLSLELFLRVFSSRGLTRLFAAVKDADLVGDVEDVFVHRDQYIRVIDQVIAFLQNRDPSIGDRIVRGGLLPEGPAFTRLKQSILVDAFGRQGTNDHARFRALLMCRDLAEMFARTVSPGFALVNYAEQLAESASSFDQIARELDRPPNPIELMLHELAAERISADVDLVAMSCPFPGNLMGSLQLGKWLGEHRPKAWRALGGGYPSTELRQLTEPRLFDTIDYLVLDDGEQPLSQICARREGRSAELKNTFTREDGRVVWHSGEGCKAPAFGDLPSPDYRGLDLTRYIDFVEYLNSAGRLWNEGRWLKLTAAHGCYWKKCSFCDITLPYIEDYDPLTAATLADQMDALHEQTGLTGFHFTDEAAPPALLVNLALELLKRGRAYHFWGNIRFDPTYTPDRCKLLARAGMMAVSGGLEIASDEILEKIAKGVTIEQAAHVCQAFSQAGILVHAYLMYGFPGETRQNTIDSLELIRQFMTLRLMESGLFHKYGTTVHAPTGKRPELFNICTAEPPFHGFARYVIPHEDLANQHPSSIHTALNRAVKSYMCGDALERDVRSWFKDPMPPTTIAADHVARLLAKPPIARDHGRVCWLGGMPEWYRGMLSVVGLQGHVYARAVPREFAETLRRCHPIGWKEGHPPKIGELERGVWEDELRPHGLVVV